MSKELRFLIVDDFSTMRRIVRNLLKELGYTNVDEAEDGAMALSKLKSEQFDFVISDWNMPVMDGLTAARTIRSLPLPASRVLIVALTADAFAESRERVRQSGMDDFLAKPVQLHDVEELLRKHFGARAVGSMGSGASPAAVPATASAAAMPASHVSKEIGRASCRERVSSPV